MCRLRTSGSRREPTARSRTSRTGRTSTRGSGIAYDLFGNGKTALKATLGRYTAKLGTEIAETANPFNTSVELHLPELDRPERQFRAGLRSRKSQRAARSRWRFLRCVRQPATSARTTPARRRYAPGVLEGYGKRDHNWDFTTEIQHELVQGLAVTGGWYHNTGGYYRYAFGQPFSSKERVTDNILVGPGDYDEFCVTAPSDPKLPGGGGYPVCGLYNMTPDQVRRQSEHRQGARRSSASSPARTTSSTSPSMPASRATSGSAAALTPGGRSAIAASSSTARRKSCTAGSSRRSTARRSSSCTASSRCRPSSWRASRFRTCPVRSSPPATPLQASQIDWVERIVRWPVARPTVIEHPAR